MLAAIDDGSWLIAIGAPAFVLILLVVLTFYGRGQRWRRARIGFYLERDPVDEREAREHVEHELREREQRETPPSDV